MADRQISKPSKKITKDSSNHNFAFELPQVNMFTTRIFFDSAKEACVSNSIIFNASKVDRITTPGIQVLISAAATAKVRGGKVNILNSSESFKNIVSSLGFINQRKDWMDSDS